MFIIIKLIADFGMATKINEPNERHLTMCGTPNFISPEVASRSPHGLATDVWSLGCMMYTLLVGRAPFDGDPSDKPLDTLNRVRFGDYQMPNDISKEAQDLLRRLLQKEPSKRIALRDVLSHPFMTKSSCIEQPQQHQQQQPYSNSAFASSASFSSSSSSLASSGPVVVGQMANHGGGNHGMLSGGGSGGMIMMRSTTPTPRQSATTPYSSSSSSLTKVLKNN